MKGLFGLFRPPRITQDQGAEALAACIVLSAAQGAEDYLNDRELFSSHPDIITPDRALQTVLEFIMVELYYVECYIAGEYRNKLDLPDFFDVLESAVCREYMKGRTQADPEFTAESFFGIWREAREMYSGDKVFLGSTVGSKDSVSGEFGARVTAIFGESRYSLIATMAHISLKACLDAHRKHKIIDNILSRVDWR